MSNLIPTMRAIIREELTRYRMPELGLVTSVLSFDSSSSDGNHQVNVTLRGSGVELQRVPVMVGRPGLSLLPRAGDLVVVTFLDGELSSPVVLGSVYHGTLRPPQAGPLELVYQPPDDEDASLRRFHVQLPGGCSITYGDDKLTVTSGATEIVVEKDGDVSISAAGNLKLQSEGDITLDAGGNVKVEARQGTTLKGMSATLEGQSSTTVKGPSIGINGMTSFSPS